MRVLVLGGGYAGRELVRQLLRYGLDVELVNRWPFHTLKTELYQFAAGSAGPREVTMAFAHGAYLTLHQGEVERIAPEERAAWVSGRRLQGDVLAVALGSEVRTFGVSGVAERCLTLDDYGTARRARERLATVTGDGSVAVVGGGLTGVEMAAELRERRPDVPVVLREALPEVVAGFPDHVRSYVHRTLESLGVKLELGRAIRTLDELGAAEVVWAAGVRPVRPVRDAGFTLEHNGRVRVDGSGQAEGFPGVYVLGDCAALPFPPSAQLAERQGVLVAEAIEARAHGEKFEPEPLHLHGLVASLGHREGFSTLFGGLVGTPARKLKTVVEWMYRWHART